MHFTASKSRYYQISPIWLNSHESKSSLYLNITSDILNQIRHNYWVRTDLKKLPPIHRDVYLYVSLLSVIMIALLSPCSVYIVFCIIVFFLVSRNMLFLSYNLHCGIRLVTVQGQMDRSIPLAIGGKVRSDQKSTNERAVRGPVPRPDGTISVSKSCTR